MDYPLSDAHDLKRKRSPAGAVPYDDHRRSPSARYDPRDPYAAERAAYEAERERRHYERERYPGADYYGDVDPYRAEYARGYEDDRYGSGYDYHRGDGRDGRDYDEWRAYEDRRRADYHAAHPGGGASEWEAYERDRERARAVERGRRGYDRERQEQRAPPARGPSGLSTARSGEGFDPMRYDGLLGFRQFSTLAREANHPASRPDAVIPADAPVGPGGVAPRDPLFAEYSAYRFNFQKRLLRQHFENCKGAMWFKEKYGDDENLVAERRKRRKMGRTGTKMRWLNELDSGKLDKLTLDYGPPSKEFLAAQSSGEGNVVEDKTATSASPKAVKDGEDDTMQAAAEATSSEPTDKPSGEAEDWTEDYEREGRRSRQLADEAAGESNGANGTASSSNLSNSNGNGAGGGGSGSLGDLTMRTRYGEERYQGATVEIPGDDHLIMVHNIGPDTPRSVIEAALSVYPTFQYLAVGEPNFTKGPGRMGWARFEAGTDVSRIVTEKNGTKLSDGTNLTIGLANRAGTARLRIIPRIANSAHRLSRDLSRVREFVAVLESQDRELFDEEKQRGEADWLEISLSERIAARLAEMGMDVELAEKVVEKFKDKKTDSAETTGEKADSDETALDVDSASTTIKKLLDLHLDAVRYVYHADFYGGIVSDFPEELHRRTMLTVRLTGVLTYKSGKDSTRDAHWLSQVEERAGLLIHPPDLDISTYGGTNIEEKSLDFAIPFASEETINAEVYGRAAEDGAPPKKQHRCAVEVPDEGSPTGKRPCGKAFKAPRFVHKHVFNKHYAVIKDSVEKFKKEEEYFNRYVSDPARSMPAYQQEPENQNTSSQDHPMAKLPLRLGNHGLMPANAQQMPMRFGGAGGMGTMMDMNMANMMSMAGRGMAAMMGMGGMGMAGAMAGQQTSGYSQPLSVRLGMTLPASNEGGRRSLDQGARSSGSSHPSSSARVPAEVGKESTATSAAPLAPPKDAKVDPRAARQARQSYHDLDGPASGSVDEIELNY